MQIIKYIPPPIRILQNIHCQIKKKLYLCTREPSVKQRLSGRLMGSVCLDDQKVNK